MASLDPTLTVLAGFAAYKLIKSFIKSKKTKRLENKEFSMKETKTNSHSSFIKTTGYNALCGVLGNVIYEIGKEMPA